MKVFIYGNIIFKEEMLEGLNKRLKNQAKPQIKNPVIQEVPIDCMIRDFENGIFSQALYDERKEAELHERYRKRTVYYIRQVVSVDDEFGILNGTEEEKQKHKAFVEECKARAKAEIYGVK